MLTGSFRTPTIGTILDAFDWSNYTLGLHSSYTVFNTPAYFLFSDTKIEDSIISWYTVPGSASQRVSVDILPYTPYSSYATEIQFNNLNYTYYWYAIG